MSVASMCDRINPPGGHRANMCPPPLRGQSPFPLLTPPPSLCAQCASPASARCHSRVNNNKGHVSWLWPGHMSLFPLLPVNDCTNVRAETGLLLGSLPSAAGSPFLVIPGRPLCIGPVLYVLYCLSQVQCSMVTSVKMYCSSQHAIPSVAAISGSKPAARRRDAPCPPGTRMFWS